VVHDVSDGECGRARDASQTVDEYAAVRLPYLVCQRINTPVSMMRPHTTLPLISCCILSTQPVLLPLNTFVSFLV